VKCHENPSDGSRVVPVQQSAERTWQECRSHCLQLLCETVAYLVGMSNVAGSNRWQNVLQNEYVTYLLTPWCRVLLEKLTGLQLVKTFPAFHWTRRFITALTCVRHLSLSWASPIQSTCSHPTSRRFILILSIHLRLGLLSGLFPSGFPTKTLYSPLSSPIRATCPGHLILLDFITRTILGEEYRSFSSSLCYLLQSPVTSSLLGPNYLKKNVRSTDFTLLNKVEEYSRKCDLLKFITFERGGHCHTRPRPWKRSYATGAKCIVVRTAPRWISLFSLLHAVVDRICIMYTVKCIVLQIGRSLDRSQLVSLDFSLI